MQSIPEDRLPLPDEIRESMDLMWAEIETIKPEIIVPTGNLDSKCVLYFLKMTTKLLKKDICQSRCLS
jgi:uracil-DNA glycosylase